MPKNPRTAKQSPSKSTTLTFPDAITAVIAGAHVTREDWKNPKIYVLRSDGFLKIHLENGTEHALLASDGDLDAADWHVIHAH